LALRNLLLEYAEHHLRRIHRGVDAQLAKMLSLRGSLMRAMVPSRCQSVSLATWRDQVVFVIAGHGDPPRPTLGAGFGERAGSSALPRSTTLPRLVGNELGAIGNVLDDQDFVALLDQLAR